MTIQKKATLRLILFAALLFPTIKPNTLYAMPKIIEKIIKKKPNPATNIRIGHGYYAQMLEQTNNADNKILLFGVAVPHIYKIANTPCEDVGIRAIADAILGAIAEKDIGFFLTLNSQTIKDKPDSIFLNHANQLMLNQNYYINNIDATLITNNPEISMYRQKMRFKIAEILNININRINIKSTTIESAGFTGEGKNITAHAVVIIDKNKYL